MALKLHDWLAASLLAVAAAAGANTAQKDAYDVKAMTGGIGQSEQARMREAVDDYNLALTFSARSGHYLADVNVEVKDNSGGIVYSKDSTGPMVLVDLPPGRYIVEAVHEGRLQRQVVDLEASGKRSLTLSWLDRDG